MVVKYWLVDGSLVTARTRAWGREGFPGVRAVLGEMERKREKTRHSRMEEEEDIIWVREMKNFYAN